MILPKTTIKKGVIIKRFAILCKFFAPFCGLKLDIKFNREVRRVRKENTSQRKTFVQLSVLAPSWQKRILYIYQKLTPHS